MVRSSPSKHQAFLVSLRNETKNLTLSLFLAFPSYLIYLYIYSNENIRNVHICFYRY
jgi:hypothetical protein